MQNKKLDHDILEMKKAMKKKREEDELIPKKWELGISLFNSSEILKKRKKTEENTSISIDPTNGSPIITNTRGRGRGRGRGSRGPRGSKSKGITRDSTTIITSSNDESFKNDMNVTSSTPSERGRGRPRGRRPGSGRGRGKGRISTSYNPIPHKIMEDSNSSHDSYLGDGISFPYSLFNQEKVTDRSTENIRNFDINKKTIEDDLDVSDLPPLKSRPLDSFLCQYTISTMNDSLHERDKVGEFMSRSIDEQMEIMSKYDKNIPKILPEANVLTREPNKEYEIIPEDEKVKQKRPITYKQIQKKELDNIQKEKIFKDDKDPYNQEFGLNPLEYHLMQDLNERFKGREKLFDEAGRIHIERERKNGELKLPVLEEVSKEYVSDFLRKSRGEKFGEYPCRLGDECIAKIMCVKYPGCSNNQNITSGFICRAFLLPSELQDYKLKKASGIPFTMEPKLCIMDNRLNTTYNYYRSLRTGEEPKELLQDHYNVVDDPKGYPSERCICPIDPKFRGITNPIAKFSSTNYNYCWRNVLNEDTGKIEKIEGIEETMMDF